MKKLLTISLINVFMVSLYASYNPNMVVSDDKLVTNNSIYKANAGKLTKSQIYDDGTNVVIGTNSSLAKLHVDGGSFLVSGTWNVGSIPSSGAGSKMFFYPAKSAFRAGSIDSNQWDSENIGENSVSMGVNGKTTGSFSFSMGYQPIASGMASTAIGWASLASGLTSTALGVITVASGSASTAIGDHTTAKSYAEMVVGIYNTDYTPISTTDWNAADRLFTIGNGNSATYTKSDAMTVLKNGNVGIGTSIPVNKLDIEGATVIGVNYSGTNTAPTNGLLVEGNVGIGTSSPVNKLDIEGGTVIGANYSGTNTAPTNGLLVEGNVGIGTNNPQAKLEVNGNIQSTGYDMTTSEIIVYSTISSPITYGSSYTTVYNLTQTLKNVGTDITRTDSSTQGTYFTINKNGLYQFYIQSTAKTSPHLYAGAVVSKNSSTLPDRTTENSLCYLYLYIGGEYTLSTSNMAFLAQGDVIRVHSPNTAAPTYTVRFEIRRIR